MPTRQPSHPNRHPPPRLRRPGRVLQVCLAVALTAGCAAVPGSRPGGTDQPPPVDAASNGDAGSTSSVANLAAGLTDPPNGDGTGALSPPETGLLDAGNTDGPEHAAAAVILDGLVAEGLLVTSIDTEVATRGSRQATVVVTVAHSPGHGHPTQSRYELDLTRTGDGWTLTGHREAG